MSADSSAVLLIAPLCIDEVIVPGSRITRAGGSGLFAALALARLGARVRLHTSLAAEDEGLLRALPAEGISVTVHPSRETTRFEIQIDRDDPNRRRIRLLASSDPIDVARLDPSGCGYALLAPLLPGDLGGNLIALLEASGLPADLGIQGLCRRVAPDGLISIASPPPVRIPSLRILAGDFAEIASTPKEIVAMAKEVVTTLGDHGARVASRDPLFRQVDVPARRATRSHREAIGLGDTFLAVYGWMRTKGLDPYEAGMHAAQAATALLEEGLPPPQ